MCPDAPVCNGTSGNDFIVPTTPNSLIYGKAGNDYICACLGQGPFYMYGNTGNDILIGGDFNDGLYGGPGNDRYDGLRGSDVIYDIDNLLNPNAALDDLASNDIASGGPGNDFIALGGGSDRIEGGPGDDSVIANPNHRDFSVDIINCGSDHDELQYHYSGDGDRFINCEFVENYDR